MRDWIRALEVVEDRLRSGARVAEIACADGARTIELARFFPASVFCAFDPSPDAIESARRAAARAGVSDRVTFEVARANEFPGSGYDVILVHGSGATSAGCQISHRSLPADPTTPRASRDLTSDPRAALDPPETRFRGAQRP